MSRFTKKNKRIVSSNIPLYKKDSFKRVMSTFAVHLVPLRTLTIQMVIS